jgi:hypothetical protein
MYKSQSAGAPNGSSGPGAGQGPGTDGAQGGEQQQPKDNVVDAEFVDVDDKK